MTVRSSALRLAQRVVSGGLTVVLVPAAPPPKSAVVWQPPSASAPASAAPIQGFIKVPRRRVFLALALREPRFRKARNRQPLRCTGATVPNASSSIRSGIDEGDVEEARQEAFEVVVRPRLAGRIADERIAVPGADQAGLDREGGVAARPVDLAADLHHAHALDGALPDADEAHVADVASALVVLGEAAMVGLELGERQGRPVRLPLVAHHRAGRADAARAAERGDAVAGLRAPALDGEDDLGLLPGGAVRHEEGGEEREDGFHGGSPGRPSGQLDAIVLDHRVGEEPLAGVLQRALGLALVGGIELDVEDLALAHAGDALDAKRPQGSLDRLPLRVEDAGFEGDGDARFHADLAGECSGPGSMRRARVPPSLAASAETPEGMGRAHLAVGSESLQLQGNLARRHSHALSALADDDRDAQPIPAL